MRLHVQHTANRPHARHAATERTRHRPGGHEHTLSTHEKDTYKYTDCIVRRSNVPAQHTGRTYGQIGQTGCALTYKINLVRDSTSQPYFVLHI